MKEQDEPCWQRKGIAINEIAIKGIRVYDKQRTVLINKVFI